MALRGFDGLLTLCSANSWLANLAIAAQALSRLIIRAYGPFVPLSDVTREPIPAKEEQLLSSSIAQTLTEASAAETKLAYVQHGIHRVKDIDNNEDMRESDYVLTFYIEKLYRDVGILAERLGSSAV